MTRNCSEEEIKAISSMGTAEDFNKLAKNHVEISLLFQVKETIRPGMTLLLPTRVVESLCDWNHFRRINWAHFKVSSVKDSAIKGEIVSHTTPFCEEDGDSLFPIDFNQLVLSKIPDILIVSVENPWRKLRERVIDSQQPRIRWRVL